MSSDMAEWLNDVLEKVGWNMDDLRKSSDNVEEKTNSNLNENKIRNKRSKYFLDDSDSEENTDFYYQSSQNVVTIKLSNNDLRQITSNELTSNSSLTPSENLKVYNYCVEKARNERIDKMKESSSTKLNKFTSDFDPSKLKYSSKDEDPSELDLKLQEREMKRRRQTYKPKNVYSSNKNYQEVLRQVIEGQMEVMKEGLQEKRRKFGK